MQEVLQGQFYRHFKGRLYQIVAVAEHSETGERMVVYQALYGDYRVFVRPYRMFVSEVDHEKYPQAAQKYRFELVKPSDMEVKNEVGAVSRETPEQREVPVRRIDPETEHGRKQEEIVFTEAAVSSDEEGVNPLLLEFLDAETLEEKLHIMIFGRNRMDDNLLNSIAISLDLVVDEKSTQEKYDEILNCLSMMEKFECNRLR